MATIRRRTPRSQRNKNGLIKYAHNVTSQSGEDGIIEKIFEMILLDDDTRTSRYCIDIGAWDGRHLSNTFNLLCNGEDWKGLLIEASLERYLELKYLHDPLGNTCVNKCVSCKPSSDDSISNIIIENIHNLMSLCKKEITPIIDFLCIDVDG